MRQSGDNASSDSRLGWFKASRHPDAMELIKANHWAFILSYVIASRARWRDGFNRHGLEIGEAYLGDYQNYGMTEQTYRSAKKFLQKWGFAEFRTTNRGTIGRLTDSRLFETISSSINEQNYRQTPDKETPQSTTNQEPRAESERPKDQGRYRAPQGEPVDGGETPSNFEMEEKCWSIAKNQCLDGDFVDAFIEMHKKDKWTIPNRLTNSREPIKHVEKALIAFCTKLEDDRCRQ